MRYSFLCFLGFSLLTMSLNGQDKSMEVIDLVGHPLESIQNELKKDGYVKAFYNLFGNKELWWHHDKGHCIDLRMQKNDKHEKVIASATAAESKKCKSALAISDSAEESFEEDEVRGGTAKLDAERAKLKSDGFVMSYWVEDVTPGRSAEYWWNESEGKCMQILWDTRDKGNVSVLECDPEKIKH